MYELFLFKNITAQIFWLHRAFISVPPIILTYFHVIYSLAGSWVGGDFWLEVFWTSPVNLRPCVPLSLSREQRAFERKLRKMSEGISRHASMVLIEDCQGDMQLKITVGPMYSSTKGELSP